MSDNRILTIVVYVLVLVFTLGQSAMATGVAGRFRLGGFLGTGLSKQEDLNDTIDDVKQLYRELGTAEDIDVDFGDDELGGGFLYGAYAEYLVNDRFVVGAEVMPLSSTGGYEMSYELSDWGYDYCVNMDMEYQTTALLTSVYGIYRVPLEKSPLALRMGIGIGRMSGAKFEANHKGIIEENIEGTIERWDASLEASGSDFTYQGIFGAEYQVADYVFICANVAYRSASVAELEVDDVDRSNVNAWENIEEGETLRWHKEPTYADFSTEDGHEVGLDYGGLYLTVSMGIEF